MIRIEEIIIKELRGIRDLPLKLQGKNFAICGPNGTGKSGIVDAIEFALTGSISRLSGEGTKDISVKDHGPHVDSRDNPEKAAVTLVLSIPSLKKTATIHRTVKNVKNPQIMPDDPDVKAVLDQAALHPEFVLSRREIIRYVLAEPGKRAKEVAALLRLDELEKLRASLQKIANATAKELKPLESGKTNAAEELARAMGITRVGSKEILDAANQRRAILSLPAITVLEADTSLKDGLTAAGATTQAKIQKAAALSDLKAAQDQAQAIGGDELQGLFKVAREGIESLDGEAPDSSAREDLLQTALKLFDDESCPVCDTEWKPEEFKKNVAGKLKALEGVTKKRAEIVKHLDLICATIQQFTDSLRLVYRHAGALTPPAATEGITKYGQDAVTALNQIRKFHPLEDTLKSLEIVRAVPVSVTNELQKISEEVGKIPEASQQDAAKEYLIMAQERLEAYRAATLRWKKGSDDAKTAAGVCEIYNNEMTKALDAIYRKVEASFIELYRAINDDEDGFLAKLIPSAGRLGFDVDFYGRGYFPPGAYHSEGHQDGMGLCLYLALMQHLLGKGFTFAVLDDVLMSVDSGHRREVSKMLIERFPDTQFIMTTHDEVWLKHMKAAGLIQSKGFAHFRKWSVDTGPAEWDDRDVWQEIDGDLDKNDVRAAASLLRHYLEHISQELCHNLRGRVEFREDGQYSLGDLLPNAIGAFGKLLKTGKASAHSWGNQDGLDKITALEKRFAATVAASQVEQWQVNAAVHYNAWASLGKNDFAQLVVAFKDMVECFRCADCQGFIYTEPEKGEPGMLRCGCTKISVNLVEKPKESRKAAG